MRVVPPAMVRRGAYIAPNVVLMPIYVNIGAYVDEGTMVDTWATVGSCAQIGRNVHLSGGVGIGGVLEPLQAEPTIIEDDCFIGARSEIVEGRDRRAGQRDLAWASSSARARASTTATRGEVSYGRVPAGVSGRAGHRCRRPTARTRLYCAVIVKQVDAKTRAKTGINELLRDRLEGSRHEYDDLSRGLISAIVAQHVEHLLGHVLGVIAHPLQP